MYSPYFLLIKKVFNVVEIKDIMEILNLLSQVSVAIYDGNLQNVPLTGLTKLVADIIKYFSFGGYIAVGILMFSLLLKIIPLPLDIYSRVATKKNALRMERMRPELEKLQKQYANNKELYSKKMMALYKKEGYSTFASCLPTIFTLVFFIVVISAFTQYSTYAKIKVFNEMAVEYSNSVRNNEDVEIRYYDVDEQGNIKKTFVVIDNITEEHESFRLGYYVEEDKLQSVTAKAQDDAAEKFLASQKENSFLWVKNIWIEDLPWKKAFVAKDAYLNTTFSYSKGCSCSATNIESSISNAEVYDVLFGSSKLDDIKNQPNGYLILVVISIGSMLISQLIMSKSQKAQLELQSVDQTGAQTSKMMQWMMPIMFGFFSFMYTASFSLYLIVSTVFSTLSTVIINKIVERKFIKTIEKEEQEKEEKRFSHLNKRK